MRRSLFLVALIALGACSLGSGSGSGGDDARSLATPAVEETALAEPEAAAAVPAPPATSPTEAAPVAKSPSQLACEASGGRYLRVKALFTCVKTPRDAGKRCTRESDCSGRCLARSQSCAPFDPLLGCNDILDDEGRRTTLCLD
ncbi:hypothetical protein LV780_10660 [Cereibacter azotoformans]|uniref:Secreted protein n=1 Tax=Cereibacter azotoformans TaxID=43057 RepID=A0A2T5KBV4_9RHOB|nr:hypothetical protein [Cereibacter azotoformans]MBO4167966.1 hypothetical protein [Cereibacter azotoformans]PTR19898.1 hypothetical protein C8J28_10322 [Cereibacter azotoformans]UIJ29764.1 hypothetical protein LV780_10660 [Cereibacter azotoformans]